MRIEPQVQEGTQSRTGGNLLGREKEKSSSETGNVSCKSQDLKEFD